MNKIQTFALCLAILTPMLATGANAEGDVPQYVVQDGKVDNKNITKHLDDIYRYLTARAAGKLPAGRPEKLPKTTS